MAGDWKQRILPASFRGIPFFVESHEQSGGRSSATHEFMNNESPITEDLGRSAKKLTMNCHVIGDQYFFIRDALISAMESPEPGILIHPYFGILDAQPNSYSVQEDWQQGRLARFSLSFTQIESDETFLSNFDPAIDFINKVTSFLSVIETSVQTTATLANLPAFAVQSTNQFFSDFVLGVESAFQGVSLNDDDAAKIREKINGMKRRAESALDSVSIFQDTDGLISTVSGAVVVPSLQNGIDTQANRDDKTSFFQTLLNQNEQQTKESEAASDKTPTRLAEKQNNKTLLFILRAILIARFTEVAAERDFSTLGDAVAIRDQLLELIEAEKNAVTDSQTFQAFQDLKVAVTNLIPRQGASFSSETTVTLAATTPALVAAYDIDGTIDDFQNFVKRNKIENPLFVSGEQRALTCG